MRPRTETYRQLCEQYNREMELMETQRRLRELRVMKTELMKVTRPIPHETLAEIAAKWKEEQRGAQTDRDGSWGDVVGFEISSMAGHTK